MTGNGCSCKGLKSCFVHAAGLFIIIFLAVTAANFATHLCPWLKGQSAQVPPAAAQVK